jgi:predicted TIM-barrel fold metal-dependent hydrolase
MLENMSKANVTKAVLMPNQGYGYDGAKSIALQYPTTFIAFIGFQNKEWITQSPGFLKIVEKALTDKDGGLFRGLGEVLFRHYAIPDRDAPDIYIPANNKNSYQVFSLSEKYNVPITIHMEAEEKTVRELEAALKDFPKAKVIWAHAGRAEASLVESMLGTYPNLYIDLSALDPSRSYGLERNPITTKDGVLTPEWKQLLIKFQDRVMTGSDMPFKDLWTRGWYVKIMDSQRALLKQLPSDVSEKIANKNASILLRGN